MTSTYKLTYFDTEGLGESIRYLFAISGLQYEDNRLPVGTKPDTEFGKVPILEVDGKVISQSAAIGRYVAKQIGLDGKTAWDAAKADEIVDTLIDVRNIYFAAFFEKDETKKVELLQAIAKTENPYYLSRFESIVEANGGHFVDKQLTWADVYFTCTMNILMGATQNFTLLNDYPNLKALHQKVVQLPGLKEYIAKRQAAKKK